MKKEHSNQMSSMRKKLIAAVAMLLVACIMTVSSTYAWFTLSTAPAIEGITTTVGANGNLEIALGSYETYYGGQKVGDAFGLTDVTAANLTWGNLIDLSDDSYGLGAIKLYPARLNVEAGVLKYQNPLGSPSYVGATGDGRVQDLKETYLGSYANSLFNYDSTRLNAGVSAIGSAADVSEREFALRNYRSDITSKRRAAQRAAEEAISLHGGALVGVALQHVNAGATDTTAYDEADLAALEGLVSKLTEANDNVGKSLKAMVLATIAAANIDALNTEETWTVANNMYAAMTIDEIMADIKTSYPGLSLSVFEDYYDMYAENKEALDDATDALEALTGTSFTWDQLSGVVEGLLNPSLMTVNGYDINTLRADAAAKGDVSAQVIEGKGLTVGMPSGSGIFADISDIAGNYSSFFRFPAGTEVEGIPVGNVKATMKTTSDFTANGGMDPLSALAEAASLLTAPGSTSATKALVDTYGYAIDFWVRTNAADSYLQLQINGEDRVYEGNTANELTRGNGSNMTFSKTQTFDKADVEKLMGAIRVVFYQVSGNASDMDATILGVATLDTANTTEDGNEVTANLQLVNYSFAGNGAIVIGAAKTDDTATAQNEAIVLTALSANTATRISALVYLDGDVADSSYFDIDDISMEGKLNLQFSSSANLVPMENSGLRGE